MGEIAPFLGGTVCVTWAPLRRDPCHGDVPMASSMAGEDAAPHGDTLAEGPWGDCEEDPALAEPGGTLHPLGAWPHPGPTAQTCSLRDLEEGPLAQTQTLRDFEKVTTSGVLGVRVGCVCQPQHEQEGTGTPPVLSPSPWGAALPLAALLADGRGPPGARVSPLVCPRRVPQIAPGGGKKRKGAVAGAPVTELRAGRERPWPRRRHVRGAGMCPPWSAGHG